MKQFISGMLLVLLAAVIYACTTPSGGSSGGGSGALLKINGRTVTAEEFLAIPQIRDAAQQFIMFEALKDEARKAGAKVDEKQFNEDLEEMKSQIKLSNQSWEDFLASQNTTEKEFLDQRRTFALFDALFKKKASVTEEEMKKVWEDDKESLINDYAAKNHLPDSEKAKVTFEQVKDEARERVLANKMFTVQADVVGNAILNTKLEIVGVKDPAKAKEIADKIMAPARKQAEEQLKRAEEQKKAEQGATGEAEAAAGAAPGQGEGTEEPPSEGENGEAPTADQDPPAEGAGE